jgi:hypothetical protein
MLIAAERFIVPLINRSANYAVSTSGALSGTYRFVDPGIIIISIPP